MDFKKSSVNFCYLNLFGLMLVAGTCGKVDTTTKRYSVSESSRDLGVKGTENGSKDQKKQIKRVGSPVVDSSASSPVPTIPPLFPTPKPSSEPLTPTTGPEVTSTPTIVPTISVTPTFEPARLSTEINRQCAPCHQSYSELKGITEARSTKTGRLIKDEIIVRIGNGSMPTSDPDYRNKEASNNIIVPLICELNAEKAAFNVVCP